MQTAHPLKTKLYRHQMNNLKFHMRYSRTADWSDCGTGKTLTALAKFRILYNSKLAKRALVICPLSVIETWASEIKSHTDFRYTILSGSIDHKIFQLKDKSQIFITTYDSMIKKELLFSILDKSFDMIICDEATMIKSRNAQRTKAITALVEFIPYSMFLSGTPITNNPESVFTIYRAMDMGETFGKNFFSSRSKFFKNIGFVYPKWVPIPEMEELLREKMYQRAVRSIKEECFDLPEKVFSKRFYELTEEQKRLYGAVCNELLHQLKLSEGNFKLKNVMSRMSKLSQLTSGFVYTDNLVKEFLPNPKLNLLKETLELIPDEKIVIYTKWSEDLNIVKLLLDKMQINWVAIEGSVPLQQRISIIDRFKNEKDPRVLIAQISTGGYGLNLMVSRTVIYYSLGYSIIEWLQSQDRIHRSGQNRTCQYYILLAKNSIDEYILNLLTRKVNISKSITDGTLRRFLDDTI